MKNKKKGKIIILSGPSGSGKTTIHEKALLSKKLKGKVSRSVSMTTRKKRQGEKNRRDYFFISAKMFLYKVRAGHFLEWARVFDHYYGTPLKHVRDLLKSGKSVLLCIDVQGARQVMKRCPEAVSIFIKPPSMEELKRRLVKRGTEEEKTLVMRLNMADKEMKEAKRYSRIVTNSVLSAACREVEQFILQEIQ